MKSQKQTQQVYIYIGKRLRETRKFHNLTLLQLSKHFEEPVSMQQIQKYEAGINRIPITKLMEIAKIFGLSIEFSLPEEF